MRIRHLGIILGLLATLAGLIPAAAAAQSSQRCFPETGYCISGPIRSYWERNGGLPVFGYPIGDQRVETVEGRTIPVQWFERDRLEIQRDGAVTAGRLGARLLELQGRPWQQFPAERPVYTPECEYFAQTRFNLCGTIRGYWHDNGGLERFGYPITPVIDEVIEGRTYKVQYFERRRIELHPENYYPYDVLLGLLGREVYAFERGNVPAEPAVDIERDQARIAAFEFFDAMSSGNFGYAADLYGGDMGQLASWNPDIVGDIYGDRETRSALLQRGCYVNGLICAPVLQVVREQKIGTRAYRFSVEFSWVHGGPLRNPATGQTRWDYDVVYTSDWNAEGYKVMQLPPYFN